MAESCPDCAGSYASPAELALHMKKAHAGGNAAESLALNPASHTPGYVCGMCGRTFATPQQLAAHDLRPHPTYGRVGRPLPT